ncbi:hypothetical protein OBBRIDRAFT_767320 [Obba rivulosa]|uniref:Uncharacterized protein n=1 Tax=Obba rivulosa TaxID=1052685 RepID=A0A8E2DTJ5_9APHY|nr:hypothetical protein OBBRIDRAFT_767320 [Obba rivulosa]
MTAYLFVLFAACLISKVTAQIIVNGQLFTQGLAIVDSPAADSTLHAGSNNSIAIDVSGDGKLPNWQTASVPGSDLSTRFDSLEIYLVSYQTNLNLSVSQGPGLLEQESGSTVKHLNWAIPTCVPSGGYNLTFYEGSHINGTAFFSITPLPLEIQNSQSSSSQCSDGVNTLRGAPQASSPPPLSPWLNTNGQVITEPSFPSANGAGHALRSSSVCAVVVCGMLALGLM